ncbi:MAG: amidohydrolase [Firmicutes bacterium]|nr:amidohydrolase [Bacillota bacterium]
MDNKIRQLVKQSADAVISLRRYFHTYPEVSGEEFNTQRKITEELCSYGLLPRKAASTGIIADLCGRNDGRMVALRADMDALKLTDKIERPYRSVNKGVCHACGHDGHMAMLLGAARVLAVLKDELSGTVRFLFQPNEEVFPGGAHALIAEGALDGVSAIVGIHLWQPLLVGHVGINASRMMAAPDEFIITVKGRGGHGSMPHQTIDPILVGAQLAVALNTIVGRKVDPLEPAVLSLGMFKAGEVYNVIPDQAVLKGTVRSFEEGVRDSIFKNIEQAAKGICAAAGAEVILEKVLGHPPVINNPSVAEVVAQAGRETLGAEQVTDIKPVMGGEDFSIYLEQVPGALAFIGAGNPDKDIVYPHHHSMFDIDEAALSHGVEVLVRAALKLLK